MGLKLFQIGLCVQPPPINGFQKAFIDILGQENYIEISCGHPRLNNEAMSMANHFKPDVIFMQIQAPNIIRKDTVKYFYDKGIKVINWTGDVRKTVPAWMLDIAPYCISSFSNMNDVNSVKAHGYKAEYLEIGYDPEIYSPIGEKVDCPEIVFMANNYGNEFPLSNFRMKIANELRRVFKGRFGLYGNGWQPNFANGSINHSQREETKYYRGCKIAINCSHFNYERYSSDRLLRILGTGAMCLSHEYSGIEKDYKKGIHLDTFSTTDGLINRINYYLDNEEERNKIRMAGNKLVLNRNTFYHQVQNILKICKF